jgi:hypothetical protein
MAKKQKSTTAPPDDALKNVSDYRFPEASRKNNPPAKIAAEGFVPLIPKAEYLYSPRRPPELRFDPTGRADELPELLAKATKRKLTEAEAWALAEALRVHEPWLEWAGNPGRRNYISLQVKDGEARLYVNGNAVAHKVLPEPIAASPHPVWVGNWKGSDRPFNGWIEEVLIARGSESEETVLGDARRLAAAYAPGESPKPLLLKGKEAALVDKGFGTEGAQSFVLPNTIPLPDTFTLELLVRPASVQTSYATIISNHPGKKGFQGLVIEQAQKRTNYYTLGFGNGKSWMPVGSFFIPPGDLHYLAVTKDKRQVCAYLDGRRIAEKLLAADVAASEYPLTIGDWFSKDRPFNGAIQEVRITGTAASAKTIADRAGTLRRAFAQ